MTIHPSKPMAPQIMEITRLLDVWPAPDQLALRDHAQVWKCEQALAEIQKLIVDCPDIFGRNIVISRFLPLLEKCKALRRRLQPAQMQSMDWPDAGYILKGRTKIRFEQGTLFPGPGVCNTVCGMYMELRARGVGSEDVLRGLKQRVYRKAILAMQNSKDVQNSHRGHGAGLLDARFFKAVHGFCRAEFGRREKDGHLPEFCPGLLEVGCFPPGMTRHLNQGARMYAIRVKDEMPILHRSSPASAKLEDVREFKAHQKRYQKIGNMGRIEESLFRSPAKGQRDLPEMYEILIIVPMGVGGTQMGLHNVVVDRSAGNCGIFDPNYGWMPSLQGFGDELPNQLLALGREYKAAGMIAYQYVRTPLRCDCKAPASAKSFLTGD